MEDAKSWAVLALLGGAAPLLSLYLLFVRRASGNSRSIFRYRKPGLGEVSGEPPADELRVFLRRLYNVTVLRSLHIVEDPTFIPEVAEEGKPDASPPGNDNEILRRLVETGQVDIRKILAAAAASEEQIARSSWLCKLTFCSPYLQFQEHLRLFELLPVRKLKCSVKLFMFLGSSSLSLSGEVTPLQVAKNIIAALEDMEKHSPPLRAIVQWDRKEIIKMAEASTTRYKSKQPLSLLDGIPVCLKEEIKVVPYHHRVGTQYLGTKPEAEDATVTRKLREAGAMIIGVSNMHELGIGTTGCNPSRHHGTARNPYNPQHFTGGSSSGSAAAVAAGLCPVAIGTDGGGSVRIPASFCGIVGLKGKIDFHG
ncbi:hypothetical protein lerEdw1_020575 [Lerista edwardsae]|nr:hypothetical protein lerEdw1_020575 [Lerista edwardsae]